MVFVYRTRTEALKGSMSKGIQKNVINECKVIACLTGQHRQMLDQINSLFGVEGAGYMKEESPIYVAWIYGVSDGCISAAT